MTDGQKYDWAFGFVSQMSTSNLESIWKCLEIRGEDDGLYNGVSYSDWYEIVECELERRGK